MRQFSGARNELFQLKALHAQDGEEKAEIWRTRA
jgi:hypothetical protein